MGLSVSRSYMCCSVRDKQGMRDGFPLDRPPHFECLEVDVQLEKPVMVAFAPLHQREASNQRRLALASQREVNIFRMPEGDMTPGEPPSMVLTHVLKLDPGYMVSSILFSDEDNSRHLVVAIGPASGRSTEGHAVRVWNCESGLSLSTSDDPRPITGTTGATGAAPNVCRPVQMQQNEGYICSLTENKALVNRLAVNKTYLLTADAAGDCRLWQKNRAFTKRGAAMLHSGGVADLAVDRLFAYSAGLEDRRICVWALPDLSPVIAIPVDIPEELLLGLASARPKAEEAQAALAEAMSSAAPSSQPCRLARVNLLRRPLSRWAGWQGSSRGPKAPRGSLFAAGVLSEGCEVAGAGAGVLMEWTLGEKPVCQSVQIAHDSPIVALIYGPYDNGPLITADSRGIFRVWEFLLERGLCFTQQIELVCSAGNDCSQGCLAVAVEQPRGLYVAAGTKRLYVWQRHSDASGHA
uniref:Cilia- and flagella-associated protein 43 n=1 Tax=Alexandrium catenella TaxID=2925 RepID=A0A7S1PZ97_ALECA